MGLVQMPAGMPQLNSWLAGIISPPCLTFLLRRWQAGMEHFNTWSIPCRQIIQDICACRLC